MIQDEKKLLCMLSIVGVFFFVEVIVGQITSSLTLTANAFHMLSDALVLLVAFISVKYSQRKADQPLQPWFSSRKYSNTFGWVRFQEVGALINSTFLLALCVSIALEAIEKFMEPSLPSDPRRVVIVSGVGFLVNLLGLLVVGGGHHHHGRISESNREDDDDDTELNGSKYKHLNGGHSHGNGNMKAVFLHLLGDALGSVIVAVTALIVMYVPHQHDVTSINTGECPCEPPPVDNQRVDFNKWILYLDPTMSLILVAIIAVPTVPLFKNAALLLMQSVPLNVDIEELKKAIEETSGVISIQDLYVWQLTGDKLIASVHIQVPCQQVYEGVASELKEKLRKFGIFSTTIQPEYGEGKCEEVCTEVEYIKN